jgi:hypothetical protein
MELWPRVENPTNNPLKFGTTITVITDNNNSIQFFIIYVPSQLLQGQLQTQRSVDKSNYIVEQYNVKSKTN